MYNVIWTVNESAKLQMVNRFICSDFYTAYPYVFITTTLLMMYVNNSYKFAMGRCVFFKKSMYAYLKIFKKTKWFSEELNFLAELLYNFPQLLFIIFCSLLIWYIFDIVCSSLYNRLTSWSLCNNGYYLIIKLSN